MTKLLIVDDEHAARFGIKKALNRCQYNIYEARDGLQALEIIKNKQIDLVLLDLNIPALSGMEVLEKISEFKFQPLVIVITAYGSEKIAVQAIKRGAYDYISKPYDVEELRLIVQHAIEKINLTNENKQLHKQIEVQKEFGKLIGQSEQIQKVYDLIQKIAKTDATVLICGESGTGKELVAREIHRQSKRSKNKFIATNCAALPENLIESELFGYEKGAFTGASEDRKGKIEEANNGSLLLDEIGDMSLNTQSKILRVLQECSFEKLGGNKSMQVNVRFIAATNKDLPNGIEEGNFREDLYYRIKVLDIYLPPLRERGNDIALLANHFLDLFRYKYNKKINTITPEAMKKLMEYYWPGNVRQLKNVLEKIVLLSTATKLTVSDLPQEIVKDNTLSINNLNNLPFKKAKKAYVREFEKQFIVQRLKLHNGNVTQTAKSLQMPRQSLQIKLKELEINPRES